MGVKKNDRGFAFPGEHSADAATVKALRDETGIGMHELGKLLSKHGGMSLRDHFAGQALAGLLANPKELSEGNEEGWSWRTGSLAGDAYQFADEMIAARET